MIARESNIIDLELCDSIKQFADLKFKRKKKQYSCHDHRYAARLVTQTHTHTH